MSNKAFKTEQSAQQPQPAPQQIQQPAPQPAPQQIQQPPMEPQPVPQPEPIQQQALNYVPALQGVHTYFSVGNSINGIQLYSYDVTLGQWRIAQAGEMEQLLRSFGISPNVINAIKNFSF